MDLGLSGLASNLDWRSLIDQLSEVERLPQRRLRLEQDRIEERNNAYGSIITQLRVLHTRVKALKEASLFSGRTAAVSDSTAASASVGSGAVQGTFRFDFQQLATAGRRLGISGAGAPLATSSDVSALALSDAGFSTAISAGTFRINNAEVTVASTDTLQSVFDKISAATGGSVTASYNAGTDRIELSSGSQIVLGSATDTSNFLQVARLHNNGTGSVSSASALGSVRLGASLGDANFAQALDYGASGTGSFRVNGVSITFAATDKASDVLKRINDSAAGVLASYDSVNDRFVLTSKTTGDVGIALEDVSGNFLAASGLSGGTLERGKDLLYTIDGGGQLRSQSNTISESSSGLTGLSVTALKEGGGATVTVASDTTAVKAAITGFVEEYNRVQSLIANRTATSTSADGKVTASVLSSEGDAESIASDLRRIAYGVVQGMAQGMDHLDALGITSNSDDDTLKVGDSEALSAALTGRMSDVAALWTNGASGLAVRLDAFLEKLAGDDGTLVSKQDLLTRQRAAMDSQIAELERVVQANRARMVDSFVAMEKAQSSINQQLQFLQQRFAAS